jgi:uncharacterized cupredoxin-like copper-binding protein
MVILLALVLTVAACGGGEEEEPQSSGAPAAEEDAAANTIAITMQDFAFATEGEPTAGPLTVMFHNEGEAIHHGILGQITGGKTAEDVEAALEKGLNGPPPPWFDDSPLDMTLVSPGESSGVTFDAREGLYVLICFMPGPENKTHYEHGMWTTFEIGPGEGEAPEPDAEISMTEQGIEAPEGLTSGPSVVAVTNDGKTDMETFVLKLADGKKLEDIDSFFNEGAQGTAPATFYGGTHTFPPGITAMLTFDLEPGTYEILASYEDKDGEIQDLPTEFTVGD